MVRIARKRIEGLSSSSSKRSLSTASVMPSAMRPSAGTDEPVAKLGDLTAEFGVVEFAVHCRSLNFGLLRNLADSASGSECEGEQRIFF